MLLVIAILAGLVLASYAIEAIWDMFCDILRWTFIGLAWLIGKAKS